MLLGLSVMSQVAIGKATDKFRLSPVPLAAVSTLLSACLCILWFFSRSFGTLLTFAILFGFFAGGYSTLWPRLNMSVSTCPDAQAFLYGFLAFGRGLGNVIAIVLSVWFTNNGGDGAQNSVGGFSDMIMLAVLVLFVSSILSIASLAMDWVKARRTKTLLSSPSA